MIRKFFLTSLILPGAFGANLTLDSAHTSVLFKISHLVISTVTGRFDKFEGSAKIDDKTGAFSNINVSIDTKSINTNEAKRDEHLRGPDFFNVEKHPKMTFVSNEVILGKDKNPMKIIGELMIGSIKKKIELTVDFKGKVKDPWGTEKIVFNLNGKISRKDFGLTWNKSLDAGGVLIGDEVEIIIEAQGNIKAGV